MDSMVAALASMAVYALVGVVLLVMLIRAKWRRAGLWGLAGVAVLSLGVPLASQIWHRMAQGAMERHEVTRPLPDMTTRTPLVIAAYGSCDYGACLAILQGRKGQATYVLPAEEMAQMDLSQPVPIADLPLQRWSAPDGDGGVVQRDVLSADERMQAAGDIDYLILSAWTYFQPIPAPVEAALRQSAALHDVPASAKVQMLLAPLDRSEGTLTLSSVTPDLLDLTPIAGPLAFPLAPLNRSSPEHRLIALDQVVESLCPRANAAGQNACRDALGP